MTIKTEKTVSVPEFAAALGVHRTTVAYWIKIGVIKAGKKNPFVNRPQYAIPESELKRVLALPK